MNGDTANKIGTLQLAILAKYYSVPFYVAAPISTFDKDSKSGSEIIIENRNQEEVFKINQIKITKSNDPRSYRQDSSKLLNTGFKSKFKVIDAIKDIKKAYLEQNLPDGENCYTVKWMKKINLN